MNDVLKIFLSLSLSGSLIILLLFLCKYFWKDKISRQWQYYIWLIVIARLLFSFAPETNLMGSIFQTVDRTVFQTDTAPQQRKQENLQNIENTFVPNTVHNGQGEGKLPIPPRSSQAIQDIITLLTDNIWLVWLLIALVLLIRKITVYQSFVRYVKAGQIPVSDITLLDRLSVLAGQAGVRKPVELCANPLISSPLLIGFFRPYIVLPSADISEKDFRYTVLHELTHYRRRDMLYKWLVQVAVCLHWFNPLVHVMSREINKACEFSCDEAIIVKLDFNSVQDYGKTLLDAMVKAGNYKETLASVTLSENKEMLKERLGAIMSFKKKSVVVKIFTSVLTLALCFSATAIGAYAADTTKGQDVWVVDGEEMEDLPEDLEEKLSKDPVVRKQLGLGDEKEDSEEDEDIGSGDGEDMDELQENLEKELSKDPVVRKQLDLEDEEKNSNSSPEKGKDIWVVDGKEMDELPEDLERELSKDPIVREQLGLGERQLGIPFDTEDKNDNDADKENSNANIVTHITSIDGTDINDVLISCDNLGIVIEKSLTNNFELDYVGANDTGNFSFDNTINPDGTLMITVSANALVNYINTSPDNKVNVVNVKIPEKMYKSFTLNMKRGGLYLPNIKGNVHVYSEESLIKVIAEQLNSNLNMNLKKSSLKFNVSGVENNVYVTGAETGNSVNMVFNKRPENLHLDATKCKGAVVLPYGWSANYKVGTERPIIDLNIKGSTTIKEK